MASFRPILPKSATQSIEDDLQEKLYFFDLVSLMRSSICNKTDLDVAEIKKLSRKEFQRVKCEVVKELQDDNVLVRLYIDLLQYVFNNIF